MKRKDFLKVLCVSFFSVCTSGCLTRKLLEPPDPHFTQYQETLKVFLITPDAQTLVILGKQFHYVFDVPPNLKPVLLGSFRISIDPIFSDFYAGYGQITGNYTLRLKKDAPEDQRQSAIKAGFTSNEAGILILSGFLTGKRYKAKDFTVETKSYAFNRPYVITISDMEPAGAGEKTAKILLTPITVAADGALFLVGIPLFAVFVVCTAINGHE